MKFTQLARCLAFFLPFSLSLSCSFHEAATSTLHNQGSNTNKIVYRDIGSAPGGYATIREAAWPNRCELGETRQGTGALFPFNEAQTLVVRGPLNLSDLVVYEKQGGDWVQISRLPQLHWQEDLFGATHDIGQYPRMNALLENGREIYARLPGAGEKLLVMRAQMPHANQGPVRDGAQNNVPAIWMLNAKVFDKPSSQYFCNCRGMGNPGGCGELDIAEVIPENHHEITTTVYSYQGAVGGKLSGRPADRFQIYAAVLRIENGVGEINVFETNHFDFGANRLSNDALNQQFLHPARHLNAGNTELRMP